MFNSKEKAYKQKRTPQKNHYNRRFEQQTKYSNLISLMYNDTIHVKGEKMYWSRPLKQAVSCEI